MPGVPSSKGCDACRARRKKCDLLQPSCTRCRRTGTVCKGMGQQRFTFVNTAQNSFLSKLPSRSEGTLSSIPKPVPSDYNGLLARALIAQLRPDNDLRYSITWLWGPHIADLPCRIGSHTALDAAVRTLMEVHHDICTFSVHTNEHLLLQTYNYAMRSVRLRLQVPAAAFEPETLCAVMLLSACSPRFEGANTVFVNPHARGAAELLKIRGFPTGQHAFERTLYGMLRSAVAVKAIVDEDIDFTEEEWKAFKDSYQGDLPVTRLMRCTLAIGQMMANARRTIPGSVEEERAYLKATQLQCELDRIIFDLRSRLYSEERKDSDPIVAARNRAQNQRDYCTGLGICAQLLCISRALSSDQGISIDRLEVLSSYMLQLVEEAKVYRPLGANWIIISLMSVWCATLQTPYQSKIQEALDFWREDTLGEESVIPRAVLHDLYTRLTFGRGWASMNVGCINPHRTGKLVLVPAKTSNF